MSSYLAYNNLSISHLYYFCKNKDLYGKSYYTNSVFKQIIVSIIKNI